MRILIVDNHALIRGGIAHVVKEPFPDADVVEAESTAAALGVMRDNTPDLALVDVRIPDLDGLDLLRAMKLGWPDVPVIMLSTYENALYMRRALAEGASGYLLKDATPEFLGHAITTAISGGGDLLSQQAMKTLVEDVETSGTGFPGSRWIEELSDRERQVLVLLSDGLSNRAIAKRLFLSETTVKSHLMVIYRKLGVTNRTQAAMIALQIGVGSVDREALLGWALPHVSGQ
jgi:DNA-binding NarL/FixJ family response regulator